MSHFTVLVHLTEQEVIDDLDSALKNKLQPYHEYECTGKKDQYVIKIDETDEMLQDYNSKEVEAVYDPDGSLMGSKYSENCSHFWQRSFITSRDEFVLPKGYELRSTPINEIYTFQGFLRDWHGHSLDGKYTSFEDGRFYHYTNPNAKWDWWSIGGRWSGMFLDMNGEKHDTIQKKDWNIAGAAAKVISKYAPFFDRFEANFEQFNALEFLSWDECCKNATDEDGKVDYDSAREFYHSQQYKKVLENLFSSEEDAEYSWLLHDPNNFYKISREDFMKERIFNSIGTFAVLDADGWHEKGSMGWFACVSDEKADWNQIYLDKLNSIPDNDYLVLVDCHI